MGKQQDIRLGAVNAVLRILANGDFSIVIGQLS